MNHIKMATLATALLLAAFPAVIISPSQTLTTTAQSLISQRMAILDGWEVVMTKVTYPGEEVTFEEIPYTARNTWVMVTVKVKNTSQNGARESDFWGTLYQSNMISSRQIQFPLSELLSESKLYDKPFLPGESRTYILLFDVPKGNQLRQILIQDWRNQYYLGI